MQLIQLSECPCLCVYKLLFITHFGFTWKKWLLVQKFLCFSPKILDSICSTVIYSHALHTNIVYIKLAKQNNFGNTYA